MHIRSANSIVAAIFALAACGYSLAQDAVTVEGVSAPRPCFRSRIGRRDAKWYRYDLGVFSICIPETMTRRRTARCGDKCFIFESADMYFDTDPTSSAWRPTFQKRYASYTHVDKPIDGKQSTVWFFQDFGEYKYVAGANIIFDRGQVGMGVYLFSKSTDPKPIANRMFTSIRFPANGNN